MKMRYSLTYKYGLLFLILLLTLPVIAQEIWVTPDGNDAHAGTAQEPMATIFMAQRKARELRRLNDPSISNGIHIILKGGVYVLDEPLLFRPEDSGTAGSPTVIMAAEGEQPVISGGVVVKGWKKLQGSVPGLPNAAKGHVWVTDIPRAGGRMIEFRQLWVNGVKASRASTLTDGTLPRILSVDKKNQILWIPKPSFRIEETRQLEFFIHQWWAIANLRVKDIRVVGDSAAVTFHQPESHIEFEHPWPAPFIDEHHTKGGNSAFYFVSAVELLNKHGEWYEDLDHGKLYYWPRQGEDMTTARVMAPYLETLVEFQGSLDFPVSYIQFKGISFQYTTWLRPSRQGHVPLQAGIYLVDAYKLKPSGTPGKASLENQAWMGRPAAGVEATCASNLLFDRCEFTHMAATGLDLIYGTRHNRVQGCVFTDIGGTALQTGFFGSADFEAHLPYNPADDREVCSFETFSNNVIRNVTNEDWGCVGIAAGFVHDVTIEHNDISDVNYTGISLGWGWTKAVNCMRNNRVYANRIQHFAKNMYDVSGIYVLSAQPNTEVKANVVSDLEKAPYAHDPKHFQYIYFDEGSSFMRATDNWTEVAKFLSNAVGPGNEWNNNGPQVADSIKSAAGLEPAYQDLLKQRAIGK